MSSSKIQKRKERVFREIINAYNNDNQERQWYIIFSFPSTGTEFTIAKYLHAYFDISTLCIIPGIGGIIIYFNNSEDLKNLLPKLINLFG